jgi:flagellar operon protein
MAQEIDGVRIPFVPIGGVEGLRSTPTVNQPGGKSFDEVLRGELDRLKFSNHAQTRLESRNIHLSEDDVKNLADAVDQASQKGSQDSLVIMKNVAYIVNVKNRTVVTAVDGDNLNENVFTNIDSAVLVKAQNFASQQ